MTSICTTIQSINLPQVYHGAMARFKAQGLMPGDVQPEQMVLGAKLQRCC